MKVAVITGLFAKGNMNINTSQNKLFVKVKIKLNDMDPGKESNQGSQIPLIFTD